MEFQRMDDRGDPAESSGSKQPVIQTPKNSLSPSSELLSSNNIKSTTSPGSLSPLNNTLPTTNLASKACQINFQDVPKINIRQTRRGCCQEIIGCEARNEFKLFRQNNSNDSSNMQFAYGIEHANCFCRTCCGSVHPFTMTVRELNTESELFTIERPCALQTGPCKCCCYQKATIFSNGSLLGTIEEQMYCCIPSFLVRDEVKRKMYKIHPPTCWFGCCMNCCTRDANGLSGCCKVPFWIFPARQKHTDGGNAQYVGTIVKQMKSTLTEVFSESDAFEVAFPEYATAEQKALLSGSAIFFNAIFFEGD